MLFVPEADESLARLASRVRVEPYDPRPGGYRTAADLSRQQLAKAGTAAGRLGVEFGTVTLDRFRALEGAFAKWTFDDVTPAVNRLRPTKDETEQLAFRRRGAHGVRASKTAEGARAGMSELEIKGFFDGELYAEAARHGPRPWPWRIPTS